MLSSFIKLRGIIFVFIFIFPSVSSSTPEEDARLNAAFGELLTAFKSAV